MRKSGKSKVEETPSKAASEDDFSEKEASAKEEMPVSPVSKNKRSKKTASVDGARNKRKKREDSEEETVEKAEEKSDGSDEEEIPLSKKMKAVKRTPAKNGLAKGKKRAAEMELEVKEEYEVESVVGARMLRGKRQFRIHWKGFNEEEDTWEAEDGLDCTEAIQKYLSTHPEEETVAEPKVSRPTKKVNKKNAKKIDDQDGQDGDESEEEVSKEEFEVDRIVDMFVKKNGKRDFLIHWKGYGTKDNTWEPEEHLHCSDLIAKYLVKVNEAKSRTEKELRVSRKPTDRFTLSMAGSGRRISRRGQGKQRARYDDAE